MSIEMTREEMRERLKDLLVHKQDERAASKLGSEKLATQLSDADRQKLDSIVEFKPFLDTLDSNDEWSAFGYHCLSLGAEGREIFLKASRNARSYDPGAPEAWWDAHADATPVTDYINIVIDAQRCGWKSVEFGEYTGDDAASLVKEEKRIELTLRPLRLDLKTCYLPPREFALYPLFPRRTVALLSSAGGLGKSHWVLYVAICIALGIRPFEGTECKKACRVVIGTAEDDYEEVERRAQKVIAAMERRGLRVDMPLLHDNFKILDMTGLGAGVLLTKTDRNATVSTGLADHILKAVGHVDLFVLDTQSRFNGGSENDNSAMAVFISECETIAKQIEGCVLVISHTGKGATRDDSYLSRGGSAGPDNARTATGLLPLDENDLEAFEIDEARVERGEVFKFVHPKANYARKLNDVFFERQDDGVVLPFSPPVKEGSSEDELVLKLLAYAERHGEISRGIMKSDYGTIFGKGVIRDKAERLFLKAVEDGLLTFKEARRSASYYVVSPKGFSDMPMQTAADKRHGMTLAVNNDLTAEDLAS